MLTLAKNGYTAQNEMMRRKTFGNSPMRILLAIVVIAITPAAAFAQHAIAKNGTQCPSGYVSAGEYCAPNRHARRAIEKIGPCPARYHPNGSYCVAEIGAPAAMPKFATCPDGFKVNGNYCVQAK
jgi:hypothetical protein